MITTFCTGLAHGDFSIMSCGPLLKFVVTAGLWELRYSEYQAFSTNVGNGCWCVECSVGYFGSECQFRCYCVRMAACDRVTGHCPAGCSHSRWGIGCLLGNTTNHNIALIYLIFSRFVVTTICLIIAR